MGRGENGLWSVLDGETGIEHSLNDSARAIWELCDGNTTVDEMAAAVAELTGMPTDDALRDVVRALDDLKGLGLVRQ
jgi:tetrahydromethanopterin S-methyltransferase subunit H